jgi:hypothetical protein
VKSREAKEVVPIDQSPTRCHMAVPARVTQRASDGEAGAGEAGSFQGFRIAAAAPLSLVMLDSLDALDSVFCVAW